MNEKLNEKKEKDFLGAHFHLIDLNAENKAREDDIIIGKVRFMESEADRFLNGAATRIQKVVRGNMGRFVARKTKRKNARGKRKESKKGKKKKSYGK